MIYNYIKTTFILNQSTNIIIIQLINCFPKYHLFFLKLFLRTFSFHHCYTSHYHSLCSQSLLMRIKILSHFSESSQVVHFTRSNTILWVNRRNNMIQYPYQWTQQELMEYHLLLMFVNES